MTRMLRKGLLARGRLRPPAGPVAALVLCLAAGSVCGQTAAERFDPNAPDETDAGELSPAAQRAAERMVSHFVGMYGEHLESPDWLARAMAVIGLSQLADARATAKLLEVLDGDKNLLVRVYAWEALWARHGSLDAAQRAAWSRGGKVLASKDALHGDLRVGLVRLIGAEGATPENLQIFSRLFGTTNSLDPADVATLYAMRGVLGRWRSGRIVKALVSAMGSLDDAYRAELVLRGLGSGVPSARSLMDKGSKVMWAETQRAWGDWLNQGKLAEPPVAAGPLEGEGSKLIPSPERLVDPSDPRWRKDLELRPLRLRQLDVVFAVDSTGSMGQVLRWMQRKVIKMMRAFGIVSREPRIGVVFYRDHGDAYVVKPVALTGDGNALASAIRGAKAKGGGDVPEAVYEALGTAVKKLNWASNTRVIILTGDAPPHPESMDKTRKLVEAAVGKGYRFHFVKARTEWGSSDLKEFDALASLGKGSATWANFYGEVLDVDVPTASGPRRGWSAFNVVAGDEAPELTRDQLVRIAQRDYTEKVDRQVVGAVLRSVLNESYHDRVDSFVNVLLEYVERPVPEKRKSFGPKPPERPHTHTGPARPAKPTKPVDPQQR